VEAEGDRYHQQASKPEVYFQIKQEKKHTGGSKTFTLPPSAASIFTYVSSSANYRQLGGGGGEELRGEMSE